MIAVKRPEVKVKGRNVDGLTLSPCYRSTIRAVPIGGSPRCIAENSCSNTWSKFIDIDDDLKTDRSSLFYCETPPSNSAYQENNSGILSLAVRTPVRFMSRYGLRRLDLQRRRSDAAGGRGPSEPV